MLSVAQHMATFLLFILGKFISNNIIYLSGISQPSSVQDALESV